MTFSLSDDEQNGVSIAVNTILKIAYGIEETQDWSAVADEWWNTTREEHEGAPIALLADSPDVVVGLALETLFGERFKAQAPSISIYVLPTEDDLPPRALFLVSVGENVKAPVGGAEYVDGAWRYPDGSEVQDELAEAITEHAESLGVEWDH